MFLLSAGCCVVTGCFSFGAASGETGSRSDAERVYAEQRGATTFRWRAVGLASEEHWHKLKYE